MTHLDVRVRNRIIIVLLLPVSALLWLSGWFLSCVAPRTSRNQAGRKDAIVMGIVLEEYEELAHPLNGTRDQDS